MRREDRKSGLRGLLWTFAGLAVVLAFAAQAQIPTGTITGTVTQDGKPVPGVTVTAKSPNLQGSRSTTTGANGDYVLVSVPPGTYRVSFSMNGFQTVESEPFDLMASQQRELNTPMKMATTAEATVRAKAEMISTTAQATTTYTADDLGKLPTPRTLLAAVVLSPGINQNGPGNAITIGGAMSFENLFTVNGVVVSDNVRTTPNNLFIEDAIQETTTITSSVSAEYGRFQGGVVNAITKSGGNQFSGSFRTTLTNDAWQAKSPALTINNANYIPGTPTTQTLNQYVVPRYEATLGGPFWRDHVWFFGAARLQNVSAAATLAQPVLTSYTAGTDEKRYEGKLTVSPLANHTLTGSYIRIDNNQTNYSFPSLPVMDFASVYDRQLPQEQVAANYNGVITNNFFVEAQYSHRKFTFVNSGGRFTDLIQGTTIRDQSKSPVEVYNSPIFCAVCPGAEEGRNNDDYLAKATYFLATPSFGSHNIAVGYDNFGGQRLSNNWQSGSSYHVLGTSSIVRNDANGNPVVYPQWAANGSSTRLVWFPIPVLSQGSDVRTQSVFLNDQWRLNNNFSFNLGVRYDKNHAKDSFGSITADDSAWSPRLAATYDPIGDSRIRFTASYARYVAAPAETQVGAGSPAGSPAQYVYNYLGPAINPDANAPTLLTSAQALQQLFTYFGITAINQPANVLPNSASVPGVNVLIASGGLASPAANEYTVGFAGQIGKRGSFRVDAIHRKYVDFYSGRIDQSTGIVTNSLGLKFDVQRVENSNDAKRKYYALNTQFDYRVTDKIRLGGNWTWSHLYGNFVGENSGSGPLRYGGQQYPEYIQQSWNVPTGDLATDQRHRVRLYGSYDVPVPPAIGLLSLGAIQAIDTGTPYGAAGTINPAAYVTNPGYQQVPTAVTYYFTGRDAFVTPTVYRTDVSLNYSKAIGPVEIFISPQVLNLFNNHQAFTVDTTVLTNASSGGGNNKFVAFNPFTQAPVQRPNGNTAVATANWDYGPNFGKATSFTSSSTQGSFQLPRTFAVSMGIRF